MSLTRILTGMTLVLSAAAAACAGGRSQQLRAATDPPPAAAMPIVHVPSGTAFRVSLRDELSPETARPGQIFAATLTSPLRTQSGEVVAPEGAPVLGHVVAVESGGRGVLRLSFDVVETFHGHAVLNARLVEIGGQRAEIAYARGTSAEGALDSIVHEGRGAIGGGPPVSGERSGLVLPDGAPLSLVLVDTVSIQKAP